uniref:Uncharacterized protein n=1 Tax=Onchocerca volvulus TaxID=6282 RepID=A0A8R1XRR0_ONCVO
MQQVRNSSLSGYICTNIVVIFAWIKDIVKASKLYPAETHSE